MHGRLKVTTLTFGGGKKHSPWGSEEGWGAQTESPGSGMKPGPFSGSEVGPAGLIQRLQQKARTSYGGKAGRRRSSKASSRRETHKDSVFPINFSLSDTALGKEQSYMTIYLHTYSLAPSSLGWALIQSKEERKNSRCWQNLCCLWRAEAALRDQTGHEGGWEPKQWCIGFSRQGRKVFSGAETRNLPRSSGNKCKTKSLRVQPKGRAWCWCQQSCSPMSLEMRTCWCETRSCFQPNARAQKNPGMFNIPTLSS